VKEFFIENEYCCIISEYCAKGTLQKILEKKDPLSEAVFLFLNVYLFVGCYNTYNSCFKWA
jgi:hypothetical protein